ncbi:MAG: hypothetical protein AAFV80_21240 [Bacteroidota bacterium]
MILSLQKRHRILWTGLAILLPVLFFLSLPEIINRAEAKAVSAEYDLMHQEKLGINKAQSQIGTILRIEVLQPLVQPSPILYYGDQFLGKLGPVGAYVFHLPKGEADLILTDAIKTDIREIIKLQ